MTAPIQEAVRALCGSRCSYPECQTYSGPSVGDCDTAIKLAPRVATLIANARAEGAAQERERAVQIARGRDFYPFGKPGAAYRAWCWEEPDASTSADSEITRHSDRIAAAIRARKEEPKP